jgi:hypothetical protein
MRQAVHQLFTKVFIDSRPLTPFLAKQPNVAVLALDQSRGPSGSGQPASQEEFLNGYTRADRRKPAELSKKHRA